MSDPDETTPATPLDPPAQPDVPNPDDPTEQPDSTPTENPSGGGGESISPPDVDAPNQEMGSELP